MRDEHEIERVLADTAAPRVVEGSHRAALKHHLLSDTRKEGSAMVTWRRVLVACCAAFVLVAAGWAAQKAFKVFVVERWQSEPETVVNPDGSVTAKVRGGAVVVGSDDPSFTQDQADARWQEMKQAISEGKYELIEVKEMENGIEAYLYRIFLSDGRVVGYGSSKPLDAPASEEETDQ